MATHLVAKARQWNGSFPPIDPDRDYYDLRSLKRSSKRAATRLLDSYEERRENKAKDIAKLAREMGKEKDDLLVLKEHQRRRERYARVLGPNYLSELDPVVEALKGIQSPDYWETERQYLENPGCLAERQKAPASTMSAGALPSQLSIKIGDHGSLDQACAAERQSNSTKEQVATGGSVADQPPLQGPAQRLQPENLLPLSRADSRAHSSNKSATRRLGRTREHKGAPLGASNRTQEEAQMFGKRKLEKVRELDDDSGAKRRKTSKLTAQHPRFKAKLVQIIYPPRL
jgi:hypothetical protein